MLEWIVWIIGVIVILLWVLLRPGRCKAGQQLPFLGVNHAHRGLHSEDKTVPENSLPAFRAAVEAGYGMEPVSYTHLLCGWSVPNYIIRC